MKRMLWVALFALALPLAAFADNTIDFVNRGGTLTASNSGLSLTGSELIAVDGLNGLKLGHMGTVSFTTGALMWGNTSCNTPGVCAEFSGGGTFSIAGNGQHGVPNGSIFSGTFDGPVTWSYIPLGGQRHEYLIVGYVSGTWMNGSTVKDQPVWMLATTRGDGTTTITFGQTEITTVPEPGTLGLLGAGLVGVAGLLKRKAKA